MRNQILKRLERTQSLFLDLCDTLTSKELSSKLGDLPSNELGQQFWCVIGARDSYLTAVNAGEWKGFNCPLSWDKTSDKESIKVELTKTHDALNSLLESKNDLNQIQEDFLLDLLEHEVQHHGQMIRYIYGLKIKIPDSWQKRYAL